MKLKDLYAVCVLTGTFGANRMPVDIQVHQTKQYIVNQKLEHFVDISFSELFVRIIVVFIYNIRFVNS